MEPSSLPEVEDRVDESARSPLVSRHFTRAGEDSFETVEWGVRDACPRDSPYHMRGVEVPAPWSQQAVDITAKLYLSKGAVPETSVRQLVHRVANRITIEGMRAGYFGWPAEVVERLGCEIADASLLPDSDEARVFYDELVYVCLHQMATFNSPVWFNIGRIDRPQAPSACYILDVEDDTESIMRWARDEAFIFKAGAGAGVNVSAIRASTETLSTGGVASGPVSFMRVPNAVAETIKSGGTTRRAARIVQLDVDHPDIVDFIRCKPREEERLRIIASAGLDVSMGEEGERNVAEMTSYQSANNSVRVTDKFMCYATDPDGMLSWQLNPRGGGDGESINASWLLDEMASAAHACADPGIMFDDTINAWNTTPNAGRIRSTNPCGELHTPDNSSCNLGALNVVNMLDDDGSVRVKDVRHVVDVMTTAMDVLVGFCELPTELLTQRTRRFRWLGLGCSNMGAAIMSKGLAYDSDQGRDFAASVMALITGRCYQHGTRLAERMGAFDGYAGNEDSMSVVIQRHRDSIPFGREDLCDTVWRAARSSWNQAIGLGREHGYRNAQASVIAPGGTTSFFMDCDTTGIEPSFSLVQYKDLSGGGSMVLVNGSVGRALESLHYTPDDAVDMIEALRLGGVDDFMALVEPRHHAVFYGANDISAEGHIRMLAAVQPFISGASSKTCNMPNSATIADIRDCFVLAWKLGVKCIAVYRDGSKARQVLSSKKKEDELVGVEAWSSVDESATERQAEDAADEALEKIEDDLRRADLVAPVMIGQEPVGGYATGGHVPLTPTRRRLPRTRRGGVTHKIHVRSSLGEHEGYISAGLYDDGTLGEVFMEGFGRMGGFVQNVLSAWSTAFSIGLQYGVPFDVLVRKHVGHSDETGGMVVLDPSGEPLVVRSCDSIVDYIARWLVSEFGDVDLQEELGVMTAAVKARKSSLLDDLSAGIVEREKEISEAVASAPEITSLLDEYMGKQSADRYRESRVAALANGNGHHKETAISAQACPECYKPMRRAGACLQCSCGYSSGGCG